MNTNNNNTFITTNSWTKHIEPLFRVLNHNEYEKTRLVSHQLLFNPKFFQKEIELEQSKYQPQQNFNISNVDQSREFLQHVMERHGAAPFDFSKGAMLPESWLLDQLLYQC